MNDKILDFLLQRAYKQEAMASTLSYEGWLQKYGLLSDEYQGNISSQHIDSHTTPPSN